MLLEKQEVVKFDPAKKAHREAAAAFLVRRAWGDSPLRFAHDPAYGSVADQVEKKLLAYYMAKEKLNIPKPKVQAVLVGTIVDGFIPKTKIVRELTAGESKQPVKKGMVRIAVAANEEKLSYTAS